MKIAVSYLKSKYDVKKTIELINKSNADYIHIPDVRGVWDNYLKYPIILAYQKMRINRVQGKMQFGIP